MIKAIFFDVDGTLMSHKTSLIPKSTLNSLFKLKQKNIKVFLATGRHMLELSQLPLYHFPFDGYALLNGQLTLDEHKQLISSNPLCYEAVNKVIPIFNDKIIPISIVEEKRLYINFINEYVEIAQKSISSSAPPIDIYKGNDIYQLTVFTNNKDDIELITHLPNCKMIQWHDQSYDVISASGDKTSGIKSLLNHFNISQNDIMAFGDGENDIEMLQYAKIGIAMGNAKQKVKSSADFITKDIDEDGIEYALQYFNIL
ncbi:MAG: Cof-type HAD-IIB family hydrolase [Erysipelotrichaceae bacterium]|nr:Cof-type HAD-IIB family hydrolase [Erysipelotrichaceae bacterium]MDY5252963.1 Cof-type HAD-IIB family hydrolase [Erysipelotrichaceae bacterium]